MKRSMVAGVPPPTVASVSSDRMCTSRSYPIRGNDWISLATTVGSSPAASSFAHALARPHDQVPAEEERAGLGRLDLVRDAEETSAPGERENAGVVTFQGPGGSRAGALP